MSQDQSHSPVIIGVGEINDRPSNPSEGLNAQELMEVALRNADEDAGGGWLGRLDSLAVVAQLSCPELDGIPAGLAERLNITPRICYQSASPSGDSPILLLNEAANRIAAGEIRAAAIAGGEALRTAAQRAGQASDLGGPGARHPAMSSAAQSLRQRYGLNSPVEVYPLYENALRAAWGQSAPEAQAESAEIWHRMSLVAADNPAAWIRKPHSAEEIVNPTPDNRLLAYPYTKLMVANSSVNQGAAFIVTSVAEARAAGLADHQMVHVGRGAAAHECDEVLERESFDRSIAMEMSLTRVLEINGMVAGDLDLVELYSCFPCVPKMARRILGWPTTKPVTVSGGLTFNGGPIGNYMSHPVARMTRKIREGAANGLLFANGGFATHNHSIVLSRTARADHALPHDFDYQSDADARRTMPPTLCPDYLGPATIETYTVIYERDGSPRHGVIVGRGAPGERFLVKVPPADKAAIDWLTRGEKEPIGSAGIVTTGQNGERVWTMMPL
jgi:acetyl-CoA C-acetyltransferase